MMGMMTLLLKILLDMKTIEFNPGASIESCFARLRIESQNCGDVVCGDFNGTIMRSDESLRIFY